MLEQLRVIVIVIAKVVAVMGRPIHMVGLVVALELSACMHD